MSADNKVTTQEVTIDNQTVEKVVTKIIFEGDNAVLTFADNSQQTADMESVSINFIYDTTGLRRVNSENSQEQKVYNLKGLQVSNSTAALKKGVYVVDGKKKIIK
jgi:hypothetical protein